MGLYCIIRLTLLSTTKNLPVNTRSSSFSVIRQVVPSKLESSRTAGRDGRDGGSSLLVFEVSTVELAIAFESAYAKYDR